MNKSEDELQKFLKENPKDVMNLNEFQSSLDTVAARQEERNRFLQRR